MDEDLSREIDAVLLQIAAARRRALRATEMATRNGAETHVVEALRDSAERMIDAHRKLMQGTLFAVPDPQLTMAADPQLSIRESTPSQ